MSFNLSNINANWTHTEGNRTWIACDFYNTVAGYNQCAERTGNSGTECVTDPGPNATKGFVCACNEYGGVAPEPISAEAQYTFGADKCSTRNSLYFFNAVLCSITITLLVTTMVYAFFVVFRLRKSLSLNVTSTTLAWTALASVAHVMWHGTIFSANVVLSIAGPMVYFQKPVCIPLFGIFQTFACISFPLMWLQIAAGVKKMKKTGSNLSKQTIGAVIGVATLIGLAFVLLASLGMSGAMSFVSAGVNLIIMIVYFVAAKKLTTAVGGGKNKTAQRVIALTYKLALALLFIILASAIFTFVSITAVGMVVANFLMPAGFASMHLLICHFVKSSNDRKGRVGAGQNGTTAANGTTTGSSGATQGNGGAKVAAVTVSTVASADKVDKV